MLGGENNMENIRNFVFIGSNGVGKTSLIEQVLFNAKLTTRVGKIEDGNTIMDSTPEEIAKKHSIHLSVANLKWKEKQLNLIDTPGAADFVGEQMLAAKAVESAVIVVNACSGFDPGLELAIGKLETIENFSTAIVINKMDNEGANFYSTIDLIKEKTSINPALICIPIGEGSSFKGVIHLIRQKAVIDDKITDIPSEMKSAVDEARQKLMEAIAETSEEMLNKYLEKGSFTEEEMLKGLQEGIILGTLSPVFACSATKNIAVSSLIDFLINEMPSPLSKNTISLIEKDEEIKYTIPKESNDKLLAYVFKYFSDPSLGEISYVRVFSGELTSGLNVFIPEKNEKDKIGAIYKLIGKKRVEVNSLKQGEIGALVKLKNARCLCSITNNTELKIKPPMLPSPYVWKTIKTLNQKDEDKISEVLNKILEEEQTAFLEYNDETHEMIIACIGINQLDLIQKTLEERYKIKTEFSHPKIPYKETIAGNSDVSYKHKKQSGGRGQYAEVYIKVSPLERGENFEFVNSIVGGAIPSKYISAVEKGLKETMINGIYAGYLVVDIKVELYDGTFHDVDSSEMAFKIAASAALKDAFLKARPILLEPIHSMQINIPEEYMGDVMGDVATKRGKIQGIEQKDNRKIICVNMPLVEIQNYFPTLKSLTQGRGRFVQSFSHYEEVTSQIAEKVVEEYKNSK